MVDKVIADDVAGGARCPECKQLWHEQRYCGLCQERSREEVVGCACGEPATTSRQVGQVYSRPIGLRARYEMCCEGCAE